MDRSRSTHGIYEKLKKNLVSKRKYRRLLDGHWLIWKDDSRMILKKEITRMRTGVM
jgi:hypothetical protein